MRRNSEGRTKKTAGPGVPQTTPDTRAAQHTPPDRAAIAPHRGPVGACKPKSSRATNETPEN
eukprot:CAMPEP_0204392674 /NCGR_PEP_ID=MMETSP0469-20131031/61885_1 /ASSEMBLY_ACC=CAM_ASM_000384 /TAXON_ID=2969 /ORGANISM="Oxyrrhis marina" /LENGTH=61 /DNA_ID=CAMNT_0051386663 /DNA_START=26 /DNA_END=208 /DNA_ORIENTATION=+